MPAVGPLVAVLTKSPVGKVAWSLLKMVGLEKVLEMAWNAIEGGVSRIGERRTAVRKARHTKDGRWAAVVVEDRTRWVVYSGVTPIDIFPAVEGDLVEAMETFDTARLREPEDVASARAVSWAKERLGRFVGGDDKADNGAATSQPDANDAVRNALAQTDEEGGQALFHALVDDFPRLLEALTNARAQTVSSHENIPAKPGVYLFREGVNPIYVGQTRNLRTRLRQHTSTTSRENQAALAWRIALREASAAGHPTTGTRKSLEADEQFAIHFVAAKQRVADMQVQFLEVEDPVTRTVFEVYAARALGTDEFNSWETH